MSVHGNKNRIPLFFVLPSCFPTQPDRSRLSMSLTARGTILILIFLLWHNVPWVYNNINEKILEIRSGNLFSRIMKHPEFCFFRERAERFGGVGVAGRVKATLICVRGSV